MNDSLPSAATSKRRRRWPKVLAGVGAVVVLGVLGTYLIPVGTSGSADYTTAAPSDTEFVTIADVDIAVSTTPYSGDGRATTLFVLLHGFGASTFSWRDVVSPLSERGDVVAYDRTGFGFSERPTEWEGDSPYGSTVQCEVVAELIGRFVNGHTSVVLVGHSAGGTLALDCVIYDDVAATHLMLIAPAALSGGGPPGIGVVKWVPPLNRLGPLLVRNISESGNDVLARSVVDQSILTEEVIAGYRAPLEVTGWERGLWEFTLSPRRTITEAQLATIRRPTLVITGDSDAIVSPADSQQIAEAIPGAAFVVLSDVGHLPQEEDPEVTIAAWDRFFADLSG